MSDVGGRERERERMGEAGRLQRDKWGGREREKEREREAERQEAQR